MKICRFDAGDAGLVDGDSIYPLGDALAVTGLTRPGATMTEIIEALANKPSAGEGLKAARSGKPLALASAKLRAPTVNPPAIWAAAANYRAHQAEMVERVGSYDRTAFSSDDLAAELFLKPASSIIGPGGTVILPKIANHVDFECELCAVIGRPARKVAFDQALDFV